MRELYFAYGSNLNPEQMARRCPGARLIGPARLEGYRLCWPRPWGPEDPGGVLGIEPAHAAKDAVWGGVWVVSEENLKSLDRYEGVAQGEYRRGWVEVKMSERAATDTREPLGGLAACLTYFAVPSDGAPFPPARWYLDTVVNGARALGLPRDYVDELAATATREV